MVLVQLVVSMQKNENRYILISLYKAQVKVDQGPPHKAIHTETNRKESGGKPQAHGHRGRSRIDKWDLIKLQSFCKIRKGHCQ